MAGDPDDVMDPDIALKDDYWLELGLNLAAGIVLLFSNVPFIIPILINRNLRMRYAILCSLFCTCAVNGISCLIRCVSYIDALARHIPTHHMSTTECTAQFTVWLDLYCFTQVPFGLMMVSVDRLLVVFLPITYFLRQKVFLLVQLVTGHTLSFFLVLAAMLISNRHERFQATSHCRQVEYLNFYCFATLVALRVIATALSAVIMVLALLKLRSHAVQIANNRGDLAFKNFMYRQDIFTKAMIFSCMFTIVFYCVPSILVFVFHVSSTKLEAGLASVFRMLTHLNCIPMSWITFSSQKEIRVEVVKKNCCCIKKYYGSFIDSAVVSKTHTVSLPAKS